VCERRERLENARARARLHSRGNCVRPRKRAGHLYLTHRPTTGRRHDVLVTSSPNADVLRYHRAFFFLGAPSRSPFRKTVRSPARAADGHRFFLSAHFNQRALIITASTYSLLDGLVIDSLAAANSRHLHLSRDRQPRLPRAHRAPRRSHFHRLTKLDLGD